MLYKPSERLHPPHSCFKYIIFINLILSINMHDPIIIVQKPVTVYYSQVASGWTPVSEIHYWSQSPPSKILDSPLHGCSYMHAWTFCYVSVIYNMYNQLHYSYVYILFISRSILCFQILSTMTNIQLAICSSRCSQLYVQKPAINFISQLIVKHQDQGNQLSHLETCGTQVVASVLSIVRVLLKPQGFLNSLVTTG